MTTAPASGAPAPDQAIQTALAGHSRDRRGSPVPAAGMIATRVMELRKRRGLMVTLIAVNIGFPAVFLLIRLLAHAFAPYANPPAGGDMIFGVLVAGFLPTFGFIVAATVGCTAGSRDLTEGMFRHLVVTGRSRLALYLARIPAGLAIVVPLVEVQAEAASDSDTTYTRRRWVGRRKRARSRTIVKIQTTRSSDRLTPLPGGSADPPRTGCQLEPRTPNLHP